MDTSSVETQMGSRMGGGDKDCGSDSNDEYDQEQPNVLGKDEEASVAITVAVLGCSSTGFGKGFGTGGEG